MQFFKRIRDAYQRLSIRNKLSIIVVTAVLIPMLLIIITFAGQLLEMITSDTIREEQNSAAQTAPLVADAVDEILNTYSDIQESPGYQALFRQQLTAAPQDALTSADGNSLTDAFQEAEKSDVISAVRFYADLPESSSCFQGEDSYFAPLSQIRGSYWYGIFQGSHPSTLFCPPLYLSHREADNLGDCAYIVPVYITTPEYDSIRCYIALYFQSELFRNILTENLINDGSLSYITNERDAVLTSSDTNMIGLYYINYDTIHDNLMSSNSFIEREITGNRVFVGFYYIESADWFMVTVLPNEPILLKTIQMMLIFLLVCLASIIAGILVSLRLSRSLTKRIAAVSRQMSLVKTDTPPVLMTEPQSVDEIGELVDSYNYMVRKINRLIAEQAESAEELRISEFNSLQAQINPHFLYNTMDMISWKAQQGKTAETTAAIRDLSRFYKLTLSRKNTITTVENEIEHADIYMRLQNMRFGDAIDFVVDIPDSLLEIQIPTLIFQPIIENSLLHGILEKESKTGTIVLTGWMETDAAVIMISDDGIGIPAEKLETLLSEKSNGNDHSSQGGHIAIYNTHRRLQILFGPDYGLSYSSTPGKGTDVEIRIPLFSKGSALLHPETSSSPETDTDPLPIVAVSTGYSGEAPETISPDTLYREGGKFPENILKVESFHSVFRQFPPDGNVFLIAHYVNDPYPEHSHDYFELNYIYSGTLINEIDHTPVYMTTGDLVIMNQSAHHSLAPLTADCLLLNICVRKEYLKKLLPHSFLLHHPMHRLISGRHADTDNYLFYPLMHNRRFQVYLFSLIQVYASSQFRETSDLERIFGNMLSELAETEEYSRRGPDQNTFRITEVLKEDALSTIPELEKKLEVSESEMKRLVKRNYGRSVSAILREGRIRHAAVLLSNRNLSMHSIARECGYGDNLDAFSADFRRIYGSEPEEYREQLI